MEAVVVVWASYCAPFLEMGGLVELWRLPVESGGERGGDRERTYGFRRGQIWMTFI